MPVLTRRLLAASGAGTVGFALSAVALAAPMSVHVHVQHKLAVRLNIRVTFRAGQLPEGGYYYGVIVLKPYKRYTRISPPPCTTSSNMQRTDYGYPLPNRAVALALTPAKSSTGHWCRGGSYEGAIFAVPHAPPAKVPTPATANRTKNHARVSRPGACLA
jgi:hypothetical protein